MIRPNFDLSKSEPRFMLFIFFLIESYSIANDNYEYKKNMSYVKNYCIGFFRLQIKIQRLFKVENG